MRFAQVNSQSTFVENIRFKWGLEKTLHHFYNRELSKIKFHDARSIFKVTDLIFRKVITFQEYSRIQFVVICSTGGNSYASYAVLGGNIVQVLL